MDPEQEKYRGYIKDLTGDPGNPIERKVKAVGRAAMVYWMIIAFVILLLFIIFFDEAIFGIEIL